MTIKSLAKMTIRHIEDETIRFWTGDNAYLEAINGRLITFNVPAASAAERHISADAAFTDSAKTVSAILGEWYACEKARVDKLAADIAALDWTRLDGLTEAEIATARKNADVLSARIAEARRFIEPLARHAAGVTIRAVVAAYRSEDVPSHCEEPASKLLAEARKGYLGEACSLREAASEYVSRVWEACEEDGILPFVDKKGNPLKAPARLAVRLQERYYKGLEGDAKKTGDVVERFETRGGLGAECILTLWKEMLSRARKAVEKTAE